MANYFYPSKKYEDDSLISPAKASPEVLCDWAVDIDRISRLAREAFLKGTPDPWAKVEAECVAQLIEAEWIALNERPCNDHRVEATIRHLKTLKTEAVLAIKTLESVERYGSRELRPQSPILSISISHRTARWPPHSPITPKMGRSALAERRRIAIKKCH